jgi:hypothetical protein
MVMAVEKMQFEYDYTHVLAEKIEIRIAKTL